MRQIVGWRPPLGLAHPPLGNPGSRHWHGKANFFCTLHFNVIMHFNLLLARRVSLVVELGGHIVFLGNGLWQFYDK